jgi:hypothetical protein
MSRSGWFLRVGAGLLVVAAVMLLVHRNSERSPSNDELAQLSHVALYELEGTATSANVTMATPTGISQFAADVPMHSKSGAVGLRQQVQSGQVLSLAAQQDMGGTTITCRITVDGVVVAENTSTGQFSIATCEAVA